MRDGDESPLPRLPADHRRGGAGPAGSDAHPRQLQGAVHPGRRDAAVRHDPHEPDEKRRGLLRGDRRVVQEGHCRGQEVRRRARCGLQQGPQLLLCARLLRSGHPGERGLRLHLRERDHPRRDLEQAARHQGPCAGQRPELHVPVQALQRQRLRPYLRRRAEERGPRRHGGGHHP